MTVSISAGVSGRFRVGADIVPGKPPARMMLMMGENTFMHLDVADAVELIDVLTHELERRGVKR